MCSIIFRILHHCVSPLKESIQSCTVTRIHTSQKGGAWFGSLNTNSLCLASLLLTDILQQLYSSISVPRGLSKKPKHIQMLTEKIIIKILSNQSGVLSIRETVMSYKHLCHLFT